MVIKEYIALTKPGIIFGNAITALGGFALASKGDFDFWLFSAMLSGLSFIIASACVFNNYIDRDIDEKMERTKNRALAKGLISGRRALIYATILGAFGVLILGRYTNLLTLSLALFGLFAYVVIYGYWKRKSIYGTVIGSISGAIPPVVGYGAVTGRLDHAAAILFVALVLWQMPHFYAIALYRLADYTKANIPVLPIKKGAFITKLNILFYIIGFILFTPILTVLKYTGYPYSLVISILGLFWLLLSLKGFSAKDDRLWAKQMFKFSLVVIIGFCLMLFNTY